MSEQFEKITIQAFRAVDLRELTIRYIIEHHRVLDDIGVSSALKMDYSWCLDPESTIIAAFHETLGMVGGVRIQAGYHDRPMAMESAIAKLDPEFRGTLSPWIERGTAELCGLWVAHRFLGHGLPKLLVPAGVAVAAQLNITSLLTFAAEYTVQLTIDSGFTRFSEAGNNGEFLYPIPNIRSYAMRIADLKELANSPEEHRARILSLRQHPEQDQMIRPKNTLLHVHYALRRDDPRMDVVRLGMVRQEDRLRRSA